MFIATLQSVFFHQIFSIAKQTDRQTNKQIELYKVEDVHNFLALIKVLDHKELFDFKGWSGCKSKVISTPSSDKYPGGVL